MVSFPDCVCLSLAALTPGGSRMEWKLQCAHQCQLVVLQSGAHRQTDLWCQEGDGGYNSPAPPHPTLHPPEGWHSAWPSDCHSIGAGQSLSDTSHTLKSHSFESWLILKVIMIPVSCTLLHLLHPLRLLVLFHQHKQHRLIISHLSDKRNNFDIQCFYLSWYTRDIWEYV